MENSSITRLLRASVATVVTRPADTKQVPVVVDASPDRSPDKVQARMKEMKRAEPEPKIASPRIVEQRRSFQPPTVIKQSRSFQPPIAKIVVGRGHDSSFDDELGGTKLVFPEATLGRLHGESMRSPGSVHAAASAPSPGSVPNPWRLNRFPDKFNTPDYAFYLPVPETPESTPNVVTFDKMRGSFPWPSDGPTPLKLVDHDGKCAREEWLVAS
jgi:hypothetical protein